MQRRTVLTGLTGVPLLFNAGACAHANTANFPTRTITMVVPYPPAGGNDLLARGLGEHLEKVWGRPVVIDNKPGGSGSIGSEFAARQAGDGHTLLMGSVATHAINPALYPALRYDADKDFAPVAYVGSTPLILTIYPSLPIDTVADLIAYAKAHPDRLAYASVGVGSAAHLAAELFKQRAGVEMLHVPYRGIAQASTDLVGGQIHMAFSNVLNVLPYLQSGKLKALGTTGRDRLQVLSHVPTIGETIADYDVELWWGVFAPAQTPPQVVAQLNAAANQWLDAAQTKSRWQREGITITSMTPAAFKALIGRDTQRWATVIREANITAQ